MKNRNESNRFLKLGLLLVIPAVMALVTITSCGKTGNPVKDLEEVAPAPPPPPPVADAQAPTEPEPFTVVEQMPQFPGGDNALRDYIGKNVTYPPDAKAKGTQGRVIVRFCVTEKGGVDKVSIIQGVSPDLDAEAMRVVGTLPAFKPGKQKGVDVPVWYHLPITFALN